MSTMEFPDGHVEKVQNAALKEIFGRMEDALARGAKKIVVYPEPHPAEGLGRRCELCGGLREDEKVHSQ